MIYLLLFWEFFKTGLLSVGGGLATLPFLYDMANRYPWFTPQELADMLAVSESTPGPIGVNMATYAGINAAGIFGGIVATLALVLPSLIIMLLIATAMQRFRESRVVISVMDILRPASVGLIAAAALTVVRVALLNTLPLSINWTALAVGVVLLLLNLKWKKLHPIVLVALGAVAGIALGL